VTRSRTNKCGSHLKHTWLKFVGILYHVIYFLCQSAQHLEIIFFHCVNNCSKLLQLGLEVCWKKFVYWYEEIYNHYHNVFHCGYWLLGFVYNHSLLCLCKGSAIVCWWPLYRRWAGNSASAWDWWTCWYTWNDSRGWVWMMNMICYQQQQHIVICLTAASMGRFLFIYSSEMTNFDKPQPLTTVQWIKLCGQV